ncbi:hypothetical protein [Candidatus Solirubrobacter pratensis]|uniref:hypothetical protein n=1 Tax=Candidatus Solirubrobacter pratensis TaxID=1298857 RepID=UPI0003FA70F5|nr:hypothetical protein [Candidatus Solirubrobacter pratensis]
MDPVVTEVSASVSVGGKFQLVKYEQDANYTFTMRRVWSGEWTEEDAKAFHAAKMADLREEVEPHAEAEYQALQDARTALNK